ncbi:hypothetical protein QAD02_019063 [Eretmocerus hayati]|uniref:Uncharacterized protein n=1 Tax=Eretmocerus hayati TaxID=131215 RepID=A0ACC2PIK0_9HYME|nr:hypothetical protein QAD02_019063 [Eretmocerus hayati]
MDEDLDFGISDLEETFNKAAGHIQSLAAQLDQDRLLGFYGLYKQATCGPCNVSSPYWYQVQAKHKWDAWNNLRDMSREVAMASYIRAVAKLDPDWERDAKSSSKAWVVVSRLPNTDTELRDIDKNLLDWVKDSNLDKVQQSLARCKGDIGLKDDNFMLPIHWAADRGDLEIFQCLVEAGSNLNATDIEGQTPLHYAASCGHAEVVKYLLSKNAQSLPDNDGMLPKDVADESLSYLF